MSCLCAHGLLVRFICRTGQRSAGGGRKHYAQSRQGNSHGSNHKTGESVTALVNDLIKLMILLNSHAPCGHQVRGECLFRRQNPGWFLAVVWPFWMNRHC